LSASTHLPTRSCAGCFSRDAQPRLERFTLSGGSLAWDPARRRAGRGAYLHPRRECLEAFVARKPFIRSLRASVPAAERARLIAEQPVS